ncbi:helix-turn-helix domain-containing protein [Fusibacter paucivorans]|uniref:Helix-turn-helix domain-containing protein n=1 Tax=Fusibacter paucivorans TaxID=76009 RepID=A0ABS5PLK1_9FIRM|nr:helix-turn-helix domain-containing protein [Fusibacter paucivorans]MBS7526043.1 helix-turn-helix domain-containing protein [Fusibacter paucivorans]
MLGTLIKELRQGKFSQRELAALLGVSHSYISKIENAEEINLSDELLSKLSEALNCELEILYLAAQRIPPEWLNCYDLTKGSVYNAIRSKLNTHTHIPMRFNEYNLIYDAFEQSKFGYAIVAIDDEKTIFASKSFLKFLDYHDASLPEVFRLLPGLSNILNQYAFNGEYRHCILPMELETTLCFVEFFAHRFESNDVRYALLEIISVHSDIESLNYMVGSDYCLSQAFENMKLGILIMKARPENNTHRILNCNKYVCELLDYSLDEMIKQKMVLADIEYQTEAQLVRQSLIHENKSLHFTSIFLKHGGDIVPVEIFAHIFETRHAKGLIYIIRAFQDPQ